MTVLINPTWCILEGDVLANLARLPAESVHCVVTSPPYWGLRDYGVPGQLGLEPTPAEYVEKMVAVFREVHRVLRSDGTLWLNMGDSFAQAGGPGWQGKNGQRADRRFTAVRDTVPMRDIGRRPPDALKPKDMIGMPWRLAFALQADGWYLRSDIIWAKPNPMPESVRDRPTKAHEYLFLMAKSERYYYDAEAIEEPCSENTHARVSNEVAGEISTSRKIPTGWDTGAGSHEGKIGRYGKQQEGGGRKNGSRLTQGLNDPRVPGRGGVNPKPASVDGGDHKGPRPKQNDSFSAAVCLLVEKRNKRSVWTIPTQGFEEAHFATFPEALVEPCIRAGTKPGGTVLDPFSGAATAGVVALSLQRHYVGIELNPEYVAMSRRRLAAVNPLAAREIGLETMLPKATSAAGG